MEINVKVSRKNIRDAQSLINKGALVFGEICPIALSLNERGYSAYITRKTAVVRRDMTRELIGVYRLPQAAQNFISLFDIDKIGDPFEFVLSERDFEFEEELIQNAFFIEQERKANEKGQDT